MRMQAVGGNNCKKWQRRKEGYRESETGEAGGDAGPAGRSRSNLQYLPWLQGVCRRYQSSPAAEKDPPLMQAMQQALTWIPSPAQVSSVQCNAALANACQGEATGRRQMESP